MKSKSMKAALAVSMMALSLGGCANTLRGGPERLDSIVQNAGYGSRYEPLKIAIKNHCYDVAYGEQKADRQTETPADKAKRNRITGALMLLADERYNEFELSLSNENRGANFAFSLASLGLTGAATIANESAAQTLAAIDTGLKGATASYSKDFLFEQTVPALQNQMRASRARVRQRIFERRELDIDKWPVCFALQDMMAYEQAGTLVGAIAEITVVSAKEKQDAEKKTEDVIATPYREGRNKDILEGYLLDPRIDATERQRRTDLGVKVIQSTSLGSDEGDLIVLVATGTEEARAIVLAGLKTAEVSPNAREALN